MYEYSAKAIKVVDGDTIDFLVDLGFGISVKQRVRLLGFDAPETFRPSCDEERAAGLKVTKFVENVLIRQKPDDITITTHKDKKGKYGRILAEVYVGNVNLNKHMFAAGMDKKEEWK